MKYLKTFEHSYIETLYNKNDYVKILDEKGKPDYRYIGKIFKVIQYNDVDQRNEPNYYVADVLNPGLNGWMAQNRLTPATELEIDTIKYNL